MGYYKIRAKIRVLGALGAVCSGAAREAGRHGVSGEEPWPSGERRGLSGSFPRGLSGEEGEKRVHRGATSQLAYGVGLWSSQAPEVCGSLKR